MREKEMISRCHDEDHDACDYVEVGVEGKEECPQNKIQVLRHMWMTYGCRIATPLSYHRNQSRVPTQGKSGSSRMPLF